MLYVIIVSLAVCLNDEQLGKSKAYMELVHISALFSFVQP